MKVQITTPWIPLRGNHDYILIVTGTDPHNLVKGNYYSHHKVITVDVGSILISYYELTFKNKIEKSTRIYRVTSDELSLLKSIDRHLNENDIEFIQLALDTQTEYSEICKQIDQLEKDLQIARNSLYMIDEELFRLSMIE